MKNTAEEKSIVPSPLNDDAEWHDIVNHIVLQLDDNDLPQDVVQAVEYHLAGFPTHEIAKKLGTTAAQVRRWFTKYPAVAKIIADNRNNLARWRLAKLDQQYLLAIKKSREILEASLTGSPIDQKLAATVAQHARFIINLLIGQKLDIRVTHEVGQATLKATQNAMDYLAERLEEQRKNSDVEPIEGVYRVIDSKFEEGPLLDEEGNPKFGELGKLDQNDEGYLCHICGKRIKYLASHIDHMHNLDDETYELTFMLEPGSLKDATPN